MTYQWGKNEPFSSQTAMFPWVTMTNQSTILDNTVQQNILWYGMNMYEDEELPGGCFHYAAEGSGPKHKVRLDPSPVCSYSAYQ